MGKNKKMRVYIASADQRRLIASFIASWLTYLPHCFAGACWNLIIAQHLHQTSS